MEVSFFNPQHLLLFFRILLLVTGAQATRNKRIVGGTLTKICDLKYQVIIATYAEKFLCGGSIIDDHYIITAAHCVQKPGSNYGCANLTVIAGYDGRQDSNFTEVRVDKAYIPKQFNIETTVGDIAVVRLSEALNISKNRCLTKLRLPTHDNYEGEEAIVSGQGVEQIDWYLDLYEIIRFEINHTARLRTMRTKIVANADCQNTYKFGFLKFMKIRDGMICAAPLRNDTTEELKGACDGDSGSPLVVNETLVGIVSTGERFCDDVMYNGIYTRVHYYRDFIEKALKADENCTLVRGPSKDHLDLCLVESDTYPKDPKDLRFFADYDLLPFYNQAASNFFSYVKYTSVKLKKKLYDNLPSWLKG